MIDSRCGLLCSSLNCNENFGCECSGCTDIDRSFWGNCEIKECCENKGLAHCGECDIIPCNRLYAYSYLDPEHGDKPQGARVQVCRQRAAKSGKQVWNNVLLTSAGWWSTFDGSLSEKEAMEYDVIYFTGGDTCAC